MPDSLVDLSTCAGRGMSFVGRPGLPWRLWRGVDRDTQSMDGICDLESYRRHLIIYHTPHQLSIHSLAVLRFPHVVLAGQVIREVFRRAILNYLLILDSLLLGFHQKLTSSSSELSISGQY